MGDSDDDTAGWREAVGFSSEPGADLVRERIRDEREAMDADMSKREAETEELLSFDERDP